MLRDKLPPNMRSPLWNDFIDCIQEESAVAKEAISEKRYLYDVYKMDYDRIVELSSILGVPFDVSVDDSLEFIQKELLSAAFRVKWKATIKLYKSFFKSIERQGEIYAYYFNGDNLVRDAKNLLSNTTAIDPQLPYVHLSKNNFTGFLGEKKSLDDGSKLDEDWGLDQAATRRNTNHLSMEIILDKVFFGEEAGLAPSEDLVPSPSLAPQTIIKYLINPKYFSYIQTNMVQSKKLTEIVHVGCQLTTIADASHYYDSLGDEVTMPDLLLNVVTTDSFDSITDPSQFASIEFGIGTKTNLPSFVYGVGTQPTALDEKLAKTIILDEEKFESTDYFGVCAQYIGNMVNDRSIGTGDGETTDFSSTLPYAPIKKGNVKLTYTRLGLTYFVNDDGFGNFNSEYGQGTIDYATGDIEFTTNISYRETVKIGDGDDVQKTFTFASPEEKRPIGTNSVFIYYVQNGTSYVAMDNGAGVISGINCTGTVVYSTGAISVTFTQAIPLQTEVNMNYSYQKIMPPDNGFDVLTEYYFVNDQVDITEACVRDISGNLVAYATFPRVRFDSFNNHLNMNFIMKKTSF